MRQAKKIYYPAGIISLALLPICCIWYLSHHGAFKKIGALDVAYFYHNDSEEYSNRTYFNALIHQGTSWRLNLPAMW